MDTPQRIVLFLISRCSAGYYLSEQWMMFVRNLPVLCSSPQCLLTAYHWLNIAAPPPAMSANICSSNITTNQWNKPIWIRVITHLWSSLTHCDKLKPLMNTTLPYLPMIQQYILIRRYTNFHWLKIIYYIL